MSACPVPRIADCFHDLVDPRIERTKRHQLLDVVTIALCAVLAGAESWVEVAEWGEIKLPWLRTWLKLPNGIPSHDTFGRVFSRLDPEQLEQGLVRWARLLATEAAGADEPTGIVAIDGKTVRAARHPGQRAPHLVSAWSSANRLVLGQVAVDDKSNEITAIPRLLRQLDLTGQTVTIDAMGCQTAIAAQIVAQGGDYVLALKENQPDMLRDVIDSFALADPEHQTTTKEKGHGRLETRTCRTIDDAAVIAWLNPTGAWPGLRTIAQVVGQRQIGETCVQHTRYYLSSLPGDAHAIAHAVRSHWGIENQVHWVLDVAFREDGSRARVGHAAANLALLRKLVLNLLRADPTRKVGVKASRLKAGWDDGYLLHVLGVTLAQ
ncbi:MAG: ISAs1 family transposase [Thermomicrobiales bacterium]|nr:ISAs1 family transposase [Thermomicrobiales bacterium]MCO5220691.1 ISAs1 family transposase [Thermomicrobiales bacterium]